MKASNDKDIYLVFEYMGKLNKIVNSSLLGLSKVNPFINRYILVYLAEFVSIYN